MINDATILFTDECLAQIANEYGDIVWCPMFLKAIQDNWPVRVGLRNSHWLNCTSISLCGNGWVHLHNDEYKYGDEKDFNLGRGVQIRARDIVMITEIDS